MAFHEDLRNHRLKKGLILEEISEETKINIRILQALEQGDYHILPVPYVRLFMRAYAQTIDYPVEDILRGLENELKLTGEQSDSDMIASDLATSIDMTGAIVSPNQNMLQAERGSQSNTTRLIGGIIVLLVVIIFGKSLLKPNAPASQTPQFPLLPAMDLSLSLDSLDLPDSLFAANSPGLTITASGYLSIISNQGSNAVDTLFQEPGESISIILKHSMQLKMYPSDAVLISIQQDTLPGSPFSNAWLVVTTDSTSGQLRTYPTL
ncbi:MAG: helix-turn-helix domain-containing protein [Candidatus Marinimicrobia bacterium]|nr:helix-turn-helix domain-containing protein [Candidatus Neomarinimicrobiota bacterium]